MRRRLAARFNVTAERRDEVIASLAFERDRDASAYWLQLSLAIGIATLGLALDSVAVVIGAMLISPLMGPLVELSLALLVGAAWPLMRAAVRILGSIVFAVAASWVITLLLPFGEPTNQVLARASPNALDLLIAVCCAVAAAQTAARPSHSATSTAAGTAIGIALVPPLCASGFGLGIGRWPIAEGAFLLFIANFCAILAFASLFFWLVGFQPRAASSFPKVSAGRGPTSALARRLARGLESDRSLRWRVGVPMLLVALVLVPLGRALAEVSWQVRTRTVVNGVIASHAELATAIALTTVAERGAVSVRATIVGSSRQAVDLARVLTAEITAAAHVQPSVRIDAVSRAVAAAERDRAVPPAVPTAEETAARLSGLASSALAHLWPGGRHGHVLGERLVLDAGSAGVEIVNDGAPIDGEVRTLLEKALAVEAGLPLAVRAFAVPVQPLRRTPADDAAWLQSVSAITDSAPLLMGHRVCVVEPAAWRAESDGDRRVDAAASGVRAAWRDRAVVQRHGHEWQIWVTTGDCVPAA
jgi:uncharacterized hydrophobic protein (TIGR00271 family)